MAEVRLSAGQAGVRFRDTAKALRQAGRTDLRKRLRQNISDAGKPVLDEVRTAVRDLQVTSSHGGGLAKRRQHNALRARSEKGRDRALRRGGGLRETVASATKLEINAKGVRFRVDSRRLPSDQQSLPRHLDSEKGWRHPVFGDRAVWVTQRGGPWFAATIKKRAPEFRKSVVDAMDATVADLAK